MKKILALGVGAIGSAAVVLTLGSGMASADESVVGQTYKDAKAALSQQGLTAVVATTVGDRKDWDDCIVSSVSKAPFLDGRGKSNADRTGYDEMQVNLNCYATYGTASAPGYSITDPQVQKQYQADQETKKQKEAEAQAKQDQAAQAELAATGAQQGGE